MSQSSGSIDSFPGNGSNISSTKIFDSNDSLSDIKNTKLQETQSYINQFDDQSQSEQQSHRPRSKYSEKQNKYSHFMIGNQIIIRNNNYVETNTYDNLSLSKNLQKHLKKQRGKKLSQFYFIPQDFKRFFWPEIESRRIMRQDEIQMYKKKIPLRKKQNNKQILKLDGFLIKVIKLSQRMLKFKWKRVVALDLTKSKLSEQMLIKLAANVSISGAFPHLKILILKQNPFKNIAPQTLKCFKWIRYLDFGQQADKCCPLSEESIKNINRFQKKYPHNKVLYYNPKKENAIQIFEKQLSQDQTEKQV